MQIVLQKSNKTQHLLCVEPIKISRRNFDAAIENVSLTTPPGTSADDTAATVAARRRNLSSLAQCASQQSDSSQHRSNHSKHSLDTVQISLLVLILTMNFPLLVAICVTNQIATWGKNEAEKRNIPRIRETTQKSTRRKM